MSKDIFQKIKDKIIVFFTTRKNYLWILVVILLLLNLLNWYLWDNVIVKNFRIPYSPVVLNFGDFVNLHFIPILGVFFSVVNLLLAIFSLKKSRLAFYFLISAAIICEILILILVRFYSTTSI